MLPILLVVQICVSQNKTLKIDTGLYRFTCQCIPDEKCNAYHKKDKYQITCRKILDFCNNAP